MLLRVPLQQASPFHVVANAQRNGSFSWASFSPVGAFCVRKHGEPCRDWLKAKAMLAMVL